jgi:diguanylate cyclase (GGDEF)-like protein
MIFPAPTDVPAELASVLCAAIDEATTQEEAVRSVLALICRRAGWAAGRAHFGGPRSVWHVAQPQAARQLQVIARNRSDAQAPEGQPWVSRRMGPFWSFILSLGGGRHLEFFATEAPARDDALLETLAQACALLAPLLRRKPAEVALRRSAPDYRAFFEAAPEPLLILDAVEGLVLDANSAACMLLGRGRPVILGKPLPAPFDSEGALRGVLRGDAASCEFALGDRLIEAESAWPELGGVRVLLLSLRDVTRRYRAEQLLRDIHQHQREPISMEHAWVDPLTGLSTRAFFERRLVQALARARAESGTLAVLFLDLDRFKMVNDSMGHTAGDEILRAAARRVRAQLRDSDVAARLGGDEFTLLLAPLHDPGEAARIAQRIQKSLQQPFTVYGAQLFASGSIGIALSAGGRAGAEELIRDADTAMSAAKAQGPGQICVFDPSMHTQARDALQMETDLRRALAKNELQVHFQPVVSLETGEVRSVEALSRWDHLKQGAIPPIKFIRVAEETGLISQLGEFVLLEACQQIARLTEPRRTPLGVSVNLSGVQLSQPDLVSRVADIVEKSRLDPRLLQLEVTETALVSQGEEAARRLRELRQMGVRVAMDDFGTGYSSLSYLHRFPIDVLKLDMSFVRGLGTDDRTTQIVHTVVMLARNLGLEVVGEGVDRPEQARTLRLLGCNYAQGFLYSPAVPFDEARRMLHF